MTPLASTPTSTPLPKPDCDDLRIFDVFIVKYDASEGGQRELKNHRDASLVSLNIALNGDFEGGGTWIDPLGRALTNEAGGVLTHPSAVLHGGRSITSGVRYILVGFLISSSRVEHVRRYVVGPESLPFTAERVGFHGSIVAAAPSDLLPAPVLVKVNI